jgi:hypothetical protein
LTRPYFLIITNNTKAAPIGETMAVAELNVSRREVLGATWAIPVAQVASPRRRGSSPAHERKLDSGSSPENKDAQPSAIIKWDRALAGLRRAEAALAAVAGTEDDDLFDRVLGRFNDALRRLLRAPAPDLAGLALKLELAGRESAWELTGAETCIAAMAREARALSR